MNRKPLSRLAGLWAIYLLAIVIFISIALLGKALGWPL